MDINESIKREPLWKRIHQILEDKIVHQKIPPGTRISDVDLSETFEVSRGPIREALLALERDGWIETKHNYGYYVKIPDPQKASQLFEVRNILEPQVAALAAKRIDENTLAILEDIYKKEANAVKEENMDLIVNLNSQFHKTVAKSTGNVLFCQMLENISKQVAWYLSAIYKTYSGHYRHGHHTLILALKNHDPEKAKKVMEEQLIQTSEAYMKLIYEYAPDNELIEPQLNQHQT